jgi:alpha-tubulin suppressor-like RCC1 family protein
MRSIGLSRRAAITAGMWAAPAITVATATPAMASSGLSLNRTAPATPGFAEDLAVARSVSVTVLQGASPVVGASILFSLSDTTWLRFPGGATADMATTDSAGLGATVLEPAPGAAPTPGEQVTLTASYDGLMVVWTITYRPATVLAAGQGGAHVLAVGLGKPYAWGNGVSGQLGTGSTGITATSPVAVTATGVLDTTTITALAVGSAHSLALDSAGKVYAWGSDGSGQLGNGADGASSVPIAVTDSGVLSGTTITAIAAGNDHSLALDSDGLVYAWGKGDSGQLGNNGVMNSQTPVAVNTSGVLSGVTVVAIAAGRDHSLALGDDGVVYGWGGNGSGQLAQPDPPVPASALFPTPVIVGNLPTSSISDKTIIAIAAGSLHNLALADDGTLHAWGFNGGGRLGDGTTTNSADPVQVDQSGVLAGKTITSIACGGNFSMALDSAGGIYTWGRGIQGELGNGAFADSSVPVAVTTAGTALAGQLVTAITGGNVTGYALAQSGLVAAWGVASSGRFGNGTNGPDAALAKAAGDLG